MSLWSSQCAGYCLAAHPVLLAGPARYYFPGHSCHLGVTRAECQLSHGHARTRNAAALRVCCHGQRTPGSAGARIAPRMAAGGRSMRWRPSLTGIRVRPVGTQ